MNNLRRLVITTSIGSVLLLASAMVASQQQSELVINDEIFCDLEHVRIASTSGNLEVIVGNLQECIPEADPLALSPLLAFPSLVMQGESFHAVWASAGAESCDLILPTGWSAGSSYGTTSAVAIDVPASTAAGSYPVVTICWNESESIESATSVAVEEEVSAPSAPPSTPSLAVEVIESSAPGSLRLTWTTSTDAAECEAQSSPHVSGWSGAVSMGTNQQTTLNDLAAANYTLRLRCSNSAGHSNWRTVSATIGSATACSARQPPSDWTRMATQNLSCVFDPNTHSWDASADCRTWTPGIWPAPFLDTSGSTKRLATGRGNPKQYIAMEISTDGMGMADTGRLTSSPSGTGMPFPRRIVTISSCPGDFHRDPIMDETGCYIEMTGLLHLFWGGPSSNRACKLQPNSTYFLNIIATDSPLGTHPEDIQPSPDCMSGHCGAVYNPQ